MALHIEDPRITRTLRRGYPETELKIVDICEGCGEEIFEGEYIYDFYGDIIHQDSSCCEAYIEKIATRETA